MTDLCLTGWMTVVEAYGAPSCVYLDYGTRDGVGSVRDRPQGQPFVSFTPHTLLNSRTWCSCVCFLVVCVLVMSCVDVVFVVFCA